MVAQVRDRVGSRVVQMEEAMTGGEHISANLARFLKGVEFPANQAELVEGAKQNGADQGVLEVLGKMPRRDYDNMAEVMEFYRKAT
jgi:uncharacterized protein DUF2795